MKHIAILLAALVLVLGVHSFTHADAPEGVQRWEYKVIELPSGDGWKAAQAAAMTKEGSDGWELVSASAYAVFKRPAK